MIVKGRGYWSKYFAMKNPKSNEILIPVSKQAGSVDRKTAKMIRFDLNAARTFWIAEAESSTDEEKRLTSDFLWELLKTLKTI